MTDGANREGHSTITLAEATTEQLAAELATRFETMVVVGLRQTPGVEDGDRVWGYRKGLVPYCLGIMRSYEMFLEDLDRDGEWNEPDDDDSGFG